MYKTRKDTASAIVLWLMLAYLSHWVILWYLKLYTIMFNKIINQNSLLYEFKEQFFYIFYIELIKLQTGT